ncbi:trans-1,2-dihydrobenzene-1,2-diol dehydrogenase-like [Pectinophora gossypiella]|uniref:trans-1,2-dihydrobenzene-1,2-diol dehydrogenase-like n=1 Tax=Pectinophora gossypiella TaxID=13191 RepID=UPI00214EFE5C|nr:trans-1,2-dihydrobenzene-1,2-diol dehydrogenase-like [Pectinophora gossypiella]
MAMNLKQVQSLTSLARLNQLLLLDAPPALFSPAYDYVRKMIQGGEMGQVLHMEVSALRRNTNGDITNGDCLLLEQGSALLHIAQFVFDDEPQNVKVTAVGKLCQEHDNAAITVILKYTRGRSIVLHMHNKVNMDINVTIYGTKKYVTMNRTWWVPNEIVTYDVDKDESNVKSLPLPVPRADYVYLLKEVVKCIANEVYESPLTTHKDMENCASLLDEIRKQIGVKFAEDED